LTEQEVSPERILLLTFTRRAAREMLARTRALVGSGASSRFVVGGTFHSVAYRTILHEAQALGLEGVSLLDASDAADLLDALRDDRLGRKLAGQYQHVLVDEYQDVNALQVEIVRALSRGHENVTVVGDDMQAIYGFRAADPAHILDFPSLYPRATVIKLERN